jgi:hypothetical protein
MEKFPGLMTLPGGRVSVAATFWRFFYWQNVLPLDIIGSWQTQ